MLSEIAVWFAATQDKRGPAILGAFLLLVVFAVIVWNILP